MEYLVREPKVEVHFTEMNNGHVVANIQAIGFSGTVPDIYLLRELDNMDEAKLWVWQKLFDLNSKIDAQIYLCKKAMMAVSEAIMSLGVTPEEVKNDERLDTSD